MSRPTIVFLPGAWILAAGYEEFLKALRQEGYAVETTNYPSHDSKEPTKTDVKGDVAHVRQSLVAPLVEDQGKDIVMISHSYGSQIGGGAGFGLSKRARQQQGKAGGIIGFIAVSGIIPQEGVAGKRALGGEAPWCVLDTPSAGYEIPNDPQRVFAADVDPSVAKSHLESIRPHSSVSFWSPQTPVLYAEEEMKGQVGYIVLHKDNAIPDFLQTQMVDETGQGWLIREMNTSHSAPFLTDIATTLRLVRELIESFEQSLGRA